MKLTLPGINQIDLIKVLARVVYRLYAITAGIAVNNPKGCGN